MRDARPCEAIPGDGTLSLPGLRLATYTFLLAAAILLHQIHETGFQQAGVGDVALDLAALWALLRPAEVRRLLLLAAVQIAACALQMPFVWNHWLFVALGNLALLACAASIARRGRGVSPEELFARVAPGLRLALVALYLMAALAKLNHAYLDPQTSCAVALYGRLATFLPLLPRGPVFDRAAIAGSLAIEIALPLLLLLRQTRLLAVVLGGAFHLLLGINDNYDFSAVLLPYYSLFVGAEIWDAGRERVRQSARVARLAEAIRRLAGEPLAFPAAAALALAAVAFGNWSGIAPLRLHTHLLRGGKLLWLGLCGVLFAALIDARLHRRAAPPAPGRDELRPRTASALLGPLLVILTGLTPYLGLNTERAFAMFSNLRTEGDEWNHLLLPARLRVFGFQDELYRIVDSSDSVLRQIAAEGATVVPLELRRQVGANPDASLVYVAGGERRELARAGDDPILGQPLPRSWAWFFWFHPVAPQGRCAH